MWSISRLPVSRTVSTAQAFADDGQAASAHLHPWVNPPFTEDVTTRNSFGCCLGEALETKKIEVLQAQIAQSFGRVPVVYKAGRCGFDRRRRPRSKP